jgi:prepilin-type processing-associated H-X9-DG protein
MNDSSSLPPLETQPTSEQPISKHRVLKRLVIGGLILILALIVVAGSLAVRRAHYWSIMRPIWDCGGCAGHLKDLGLACKMFANESPGNVYPQLSEEPGRLMFTMRDTLDGAAMYPNYIHELEMFVCHSHPNCYELMKRRNASDPTLVDDHSYLYLGYTVKNDEEMLAFAEAYNERASKGLPFDTDLPAAPGHGTAGQDKILRLRDGVERYYITGAASPEASGKARAEIPIIIDRPQHVPTGGNVLYIDGHVEFLRYPGKWPMTEPAISALMSLAGR